MVQDPEGPVSDFTGQDNPDETSSDPNPAERKRVARMTTHARHLAPSSNKAKANLYKAERHAEQTGVFAVITPSDLQDAASKKPRHAAPAHSRKAVQKVREAEARRNLALAEASNATDGERTVLAAPATVAPYPSVEEANAEDAARPQQPASPTPKPAAPAPAAATAGQPADATPHEDVEGESKGHVGLAIGIIAGVAAALVAIYVGGAFFFQGTFMPNTTLNGVDVSMQSKADVAAKNETDLGNYRLAVSGEGLDFPVTASDAGLNFDGESYVNNAIDQTDPWSWPVTIWEPRTITTDQGTSYDEGKVDSLVNQKVSEFNETAQPPTNASVSYDDASGAYKVNPSSVGTQVDPQVIASQVKDAVSTLQTKTTIGDDALVQPTLTEKDEQLNAAASKANSFLDKTIALNMNGQEAAKVDGGLIKNWVVIGDDLQPTLNTDAITEWGRNDLSSQLDTITRDRTYTRADGKVVTVPGDGSYGWSIDSAALAPQITDAVVNGNTTTIDVPVLQSASQPPDAGGRDWGNRYIDVDLSEQHARMYGDDGALIWESPIVSGDSSKGHDTPTGVYTIDEYFNKENPSSTLIGYYPGTNVKEYESYVRYWMPFIGNSVGLHDADWRGSFGGSINTYNGSHGCVNLPVDAAGELKDLINQGDVVVVHY